MSDKKNLWEYLLSFDSKIKSIYIKIVFRKREKNQSEIAEEAIEEYLDRYERKTASIKRLYFFAKKC